MDRKAAFGPPKVMKNSFCPAMTLPGSVARPFVISTGEVMGLGPPNVMKNIFCPATTVPGSAAFPFVISTGAQRSGEISVWMLSPGNVFDRRSGPLARPR
jgi:hypothetical protein